MTTMGREPARKTLDIRDVSMSFGNKRVLDQVSLSIYPGRLWRSWGLVAAESPRCSIS